MIYPVNNYPVNWVDGMKISKNHFIDSDKHFTDLIRDAASVYINEFNFGLLPPIPGNNDYIDLKVSENNGNAIHLTVNYCNAITVGGSRIFIDARSFSYKQLFTELRSNGPDETGKGRYFDVVLTANPYQRQPIGTPSPDENPPRHPYTEIRYNLTITPADQVNPGQLGPYHLVIGKILNKGGILNIEENYIPACTCLLSHPALVAFHRSCITTIDNIQKNGFSIIRKIHDKNKGSSLAKNFLMVCKDMMSFIAQHHFFLNNEVTYQPPIRLISAMASMAHVFYTSLRFVQSEEREELLKYIFEWTNQTPAEVDQMLLNTIEIRYNHHNIRSAVETVNFCLKNLETIWSKMDSLEFIGQRKENIVVATQTVQSQPEPTRKKWSILD